MPKRYRSRSRRPRRSIKRRSLKRKSSFRRSARSFDPFPASKIVTLRYCESISINPTTGIPSTHLFYANGINDPNQTGAGHQPFGHDQWQAIYNHYEVVKSKITVDFVCSDNTTTAPATSVVGIALRDDATAITDMDNIREGKTATTRLLNLYGKAKLTKHYNRKVMFPTHTTSDSSTTQTPFGNNPSEAAFFHVFVAPVTSATDAANVNCVVTIEYLVKLWELRDFGAS